MPIPGHMVDSSVNHPSLATFIPARAVPGAPVGSTVAIGTLMTGHLEGEELVAVDWNGGGGGGDGRSGGDKDDDDDDSLGANRTDERSSSCFFGSSLRAVVVVPRSRTQAESERTQKEASGEEVKKGEWKRERERESSCWSSFFFFFAALARSKFTFFSFKKSPQVFSQNSLLSISRWLRSTSRSSRTTSCSAACRNQTLRKVCSKREREGNAFASLFSFLFVASPSIERQVRLIFFRP